MVKNLPAMQETQVLSLGQKFPWRREWLPLQYSCLENSMDRGAWQSTAHGVSKSRIQLSNHHTPGIRSRNNFRHLAQLFISPESEHLPWWGVVCSPAQWLLTFCLNTSGDRGAKVSPLFGWLITKLSFMLWLQFLPLSSSCLYWGQICCFFFTLWHVYYHCSRQFLSKYNQLSSQTLLPLLSLANTWISSRALWTTQFSLQVENCCPRRKSTHTWTENWREKSPGGKWRPTTNGKTQQRGHGKIAKVETYFQFPSDLLPLISRTCDDIPKAVSYLIISEAHGVKINGKKPFKLVWKNRSFEHIDYLTPHLNLLGGVSLWRLQVRFCLIEI